MKSEVGNLSVQDLLGRYATILDELRKRDVVRTRNNPVQGYAEWLACKALHLERQAESNKGFDAVGPDGKRYEIKGCANPRRQLSVIRNLDEKSFDFLIGVLFDSGFEFLEAYKIPHRLLAKYSRYREHMNGHILILKGPILAAKRVERLDPLIRPILET